MRIMCHNGEINTLRGNKNWMRAREGLIESRILGDGLASLFPIAEPDSSDSGTFDNVLELLLMAGRSLPEAIMMMIPEAWENNAAMDAEVRAFYEFHSCLMEPWDGPASIAFTDGSVIGAVLDRNGLRPGRFYVTHDDLVIMASEAGVLDMPPDRIKLKGRVRPGRMFLVDFQAGRIVEDQEIKREAAQRRPYQRWLARQVVRLVDIPASERAREAEAPRPAAAPEGAAPEAATPEGAAKSLYPRLRAFGYTREHCSIILKPMAENAAEPLGSMGNDAPLACLSDDVKLVSDYFKQLFAQVTNPPIDSIREDIIMSLRCFIGPEGNLLEPRESDCHRLLLESPFLTEAELAALRTMNHRGWRTAVLDATHPVAPGAAPLVDALERLCREAERAVEQGASLVLLSDRSAGPEAVPVSMLMAVGAVHHHLVRRSKRTRIGIVVESGEPREVHDFCMLLGYGADAVNPYLAHELLRHMHAEGVLSRDLEADRFVERYHTALSKGMLKVFGKMGISTLQSYKGAQIFEAVGLNDEVVDRCFAGTVSRLQGAGFEVLAEEALRRHRQGYPPRGGHQAPLLPNPGEYQWRANGERHMWNPEAIALLQRAVRSEDPAAFRRFTEICDGAQESLCTLRGLMRPRQRRSVPLAEVEPARDIVKRFCTGAMSFGSISREAHETIAIAMNRLGGKSNTGEGGELSERYVPLPGGDSRRSAIKQVASGRFGVTSYYLTNADELQIKMAQGAKPGEGGELPGYKVLDLIASTRHSTPGVGLISPPPHHDIYSIEDLAQLIYDLKNANPQARISVKLVSEAGVGTVAAGVAKAHADVILVSGHDGGTGASPLTGIKHAGLPWELGLAEAHQTLVMNRLRSRVVLQTDGQLKTGRDVVIAALLGAEEFGFSTAALVTLGCTLMRKCHTNTCPFGIATQDPRLRARFAGRPEHLVRYFTYLAEDVRRHMAAMGLRRMDEMIGRIELLEREEAISRWKAAGLDLSAILDPPPALRGHVYCTEKQNHGLEDTLDRLILRDAGVALDEGRSYSASLPIRNVHRAVGTTLSHEISRRWREPGLPQDTIRLLFRGSAGQSFGAWLTGGVTFVLEGDANDYVGKGLCGGRIIVYPPRESTFAAEENIVIGSVAFYGATGGEAYIRGQAAERFCVRNSGARVVVEGVGDHGCEYMTGGRVVVLGGTGRNFAAGMSGGIAYVWDPLGVFPTLCNTRLVALEDLTGGGEQAEVEGMILRHHALTGSEVAERILADWARELRRFVKVMPLDYKRVLEEGTVARRGKVVVEPAVRPATVEVSHG